MHGACALTSLRLHHCFATTPTAVSTTLIRLHYFDSLVPSEGCNFHNFDSLLLFIHYFDSLASGSLELCVYGVPVVFTDAGCPSDCCSWILAVFRRSVRVLFTVCDRLALCVALLKTLSNGGAFAVKDLVEWGRTYRIDYLVVVPPGLFA